MVSAVLEQSSERKIKNITFRKGAREYKEVTKYDTWPYRVVHTQSSYYSLYCLYVYFGRKIQYLLCITKNIKINELAYWLYLTRAILHLAKN